MKTVKDYDYSYEHFKKRLKERYDTDITREDYDYLNSDVKQHRHIGMLISTDNNGDQEVYDYSLTNTLKILIVWSVSKDRVTTVLKPEIKENYDFKLKSTSDTLCGCLGREHKMKRIHHSKTVCIYPGCDGCC